MNYIDDDYVIDELTQIHIKGYDIEVDWLAEKFEPAQLASPRIKKSIGYWAGTLKQHLSSQGVELKRITSLHFKWPAGQRKYMAALDDRGKAYKIFVNEHK